MSKVKWAPTMLLSLAGLLFAGLTISSLISGLERWVGLLMLLAIAVSAARIAPLAPVKNGFVAGFFTALLAIWTQAAFLPLYFENNPSYREIEIPMGLSPLTWTVFFAPFGALVAGVITALMAWAAAKLQSAGEAS